MYEDGVTYEDMGSYEDRAPEPVWGGAKRPWWNGYGDRATVLDPSDGRVVAERALPGYSYRARLTAAGDCLAVVGTAARPTHRLRVFRWK